MTVVVVVAMIVWHRHDDMVATLVFTDGCRDTGIMIAPMVTVTIVVMMVVVLVGISHSPYESHSDSCYD